jgi:hexosaminidase
LQHPSHKNGRNWNGINPLNDVYAFPSNLKLTESQEKQVRGIQACLWTETTITQSRRDFMTWPRLIALAESAWTVEKNKDFPSFEDRLKPELTWLTKKGIGFYDVYRNSAEVTDSGAKQEYLDNAE